MNADISFSPDAWRKGADAVSDEAQDLATVISRALSHVSDLGQLGAAAGATNADMAFALIFPPAVAAVQQTAQGIVDNLGAAADVMGQTATAYADTEGVNTDASSDIG